MVLKQSYISEYLLGILINRSLSYLIHLIRFWHWSVLFPRRMDLSLSFFPSYTHNQFRCVFCSPDFAHVINWVAHNNQNILHWWTMSVDMTTIFGRIMKTLSLCKDVTLTYNHIHVEIICRSCVRTQTKRIVHSYSTWIYHNYYLKFKHSII